MGGRREKIRGGSVVRGHRMWEGLEQAVQQQGAVKAVNKAG